MSGKIFIIDDADFIIDMMRIILEEGGFTVAGYSTDSTEAVESLRVLSESEGQSAVDVVLVDLHMPKADGFETAQEIRKIFPSVKLVIVSANSSLPVALKARELKIDGFVVKPFEPDVLLAEVKKLL